MNSSSDVEKNRAALKQYKENAKNPALKQLEELLKRHWEVK